MGRRSERRDGRKGKGSVPEWARGGLWVWNRALPPSSYVTLGKERHLCASVASSVEQRGK